MRSLLSLLGLVIGFLLFCYGFAFGISWPLIVSVLGFGLTVLCVGSSSRHDAKSLRNWLLAALFADLLVLWGLIELLADDWDGRLRQFIIDWAVLWFVWQLLFWVVWLLQPERD
jgi:hypothetical protein